MTSGTIHPVVPIISVCGEMVVVAFIIFDIPKSDTLTSMYAAFAISGICAGLISMFADLRSLCVIFCHGKHFMAYGWQSYIGIFSQISLQTRNKVLIFLFILIYFQLHNENQIFGSGNYFTLFHPHFWQLKTSKITSFSSFSFLILLSGEILQVKNRPVSTWLG